jgi:hypothetical protein
MKLARPAILGLVLLGAAAVGAALDAKMFFAAWLAAWWWCVGVVLGAFVNAWMHRLSGGAWGGAVAPVALALGRRLPWLLVLGLPILVGVPMLYPWAGDPQAAFAGHAEPTFARAWLSPPFFGARLVAYALVWCWLARQRSLASGGRAALALIVHTIVTSLAAIDLVMSLMPQWYSTGFGLVVLSNQALAGAAFAVAWPIAASAALRAPNAGAPPLSRDLGNLLLMWTMTWAYLAFMQFLVIWAENLPREIAWYVPRLQTGWSGIAVALVVLQLALPFLALLSRSVKDRPGRLRWVAALLLASSALDVAWAVLPSVAPHDPNAWWLAPLATVGMALVVFAGVPQTARRLAEQRAAAVDGTGEEVRHARA